jgi:uncharacterized membrane protein YhaH (DUF805 family)
MEKYKKTPQVGFIEAINYGFREKFSFDLGRSRRSEFWWFTLLFVIGNALLDGLSYIISQNRIPGANWVVFALLIYLYSAEAFVFVRRLHDTSHSGYWWFLLLIGRLCISTFAIVFWWLPIISIVCYILIAYFGCLDSDKGDNEYGEATKYILVEEQD